MKPRLESLQAQLLKETYVVRDREAPLGVVVSAVFRRRVSPPAAGHAIRADDDPSHNSASQPLSDACRRSEPREIAGVSDMVRDTCHGLDGRPGECTSDADALRARRR